MEFKDLARLRWLDRKEAQAAKGGEDFGGFKDFNLARVVLLPYRALSRLDFKEIARADLLSKKHTTLE